MSAKSTEVSFIIELKLHGLTQEIPTLI